FFQAEDGIRDFHVTGVQTCALPISARYNRRVIGYEADQIARGGVFVCLGYDGTARIERGFVRPEDEVPQQEETEGADGEVIEDRSEERRVGKESRSRWSTYDVQINA